MNYLPAPKKQTQNKPNFPKAKMNKKSLAKKSGHTRCRLSHIFGLQFGLIVAKYSKICNHRFVSDKKVVQRAEQYLSFAIDVVN